MEKKTLFQEAMSEFTVEKFWTVGIFCFSIIALMGVLTFIFSWDVTPWYQKVAQVMTIVFQLALAYLFFWLLKKNKQVDNSAMEDFAKNLETDEDMIKLMDNLQNKEVKKKK